MRILSKIGIVSSLAAGLCAQKRPSEGARSVKIQCKDRDGSVVAGAEVHLFQRRENPGGGGLWRAFGPFRTDDSGTATSPVALTYGGGRFDRFVYCRVPGKLVGVGRGATFLTAKSPKQSGTIDVIMCPSRSLSGKVSVPKGLRPESVRVKIISVYVFDGRRMSNGVDFGSAFPRQQHFQGLDTALRAILDARVSKQGEFVLEEVPKDGRIYIVAEGEGMGQAQYANIRRGPQDPPQPKIPDVLEFEMQPEATLGGRVVDPTGATIADAQVSARIVAGSGIVHHSTFAATTDADGNYKIRGIPDATISLSVKTKSGDWCFRPEQIDLRAGAVQARRLRLERAIVVSGTVIDPSSGRPVAGASISAITEDRPSASLGHGRSDHRGRFSMRLPKGLAKLYFSGVPTGYRYPNPQIVAELDVQKRVEDLQLELTGK